QSLRICLSKLEIIESRNIPSSGSSFSSAIFNPSFFRRLLIKSVVRAVSRSRSKASNAGRKKGSNRRSKCKRNVDVSLNQFKSIEPVLALGIGRLTFEFETDIGSNPVGVTCWIDRLDSGLSNKCSKIAK